MWNQPPFVGYNTDEANRCYAADRKGPPMNRMTTWKATLAVMSGMALVASVAYAQDPPDQSGTRRAPTEPPQIAPDRGEPRQVGAGIYADFNFPDPDRPFGRARYLDPYRRYGSYYHQRRRGDHRRYSYDDYTYRFGVPYGDPIEHDVGQAYRQGVSDGQNYERFEIQAERGLGAYLDAMADGHDAFFQGHYGAAARFFLLAAELNQGDPSARLCAVHCETALQHFEPAARLLHRALELQPKIVYLPLDVRGSYGVPGDFERNITALGTAVQRDADNAGLRLLQGYYHYFSSRPSEAAQALAAAADLAPDDRVIQRFARVVAMSAPARE